MDGRRINARDTVTEGLPLLEVRNLSVVYAVGTGFRGRPRDSIKAVDGVSFSIPRGKTLGLVGESGSGKSTTARAIVRLVPTQTGEVLLDGEDWLKLASDELRRQRRRIQIIFQDPYASLDPRQTITDILSEPLRLHGMSRNELLLARVGELLRMVGLEPEAGAHYPHEFSGGQRQRVCIARALALDPELLVCDEPVSALDVSIQAQVLNLMQKLQAQLGLTYLFIAHDLAVVRQMADVVAVMYLGKIVEIGEADDLFARPLHPYTLALRSAVPVPSTRVERARHRIVLSGDIPDPAHPPQGCRFHPRCWLWERLGRPEVCKVDEPPLRPPDIPGGSHAVACHFTDEAAAFEIGGSSRTEDKARPSKEGPIN